MFYQMLIKNVLYDYKQVTCNEIKKLFNLILLGISKIEQEDKDPNQYQKDCSNEATPIGISIREPTSNQEISNGTGN